MPVGLEAAGLLPEPAQHDAAPADRDVQLSHDLHQRGPVVRDLVGQVVQLPGGRLVPACLGGTP